MEKQTLKKKIADLESQVGGLEKELDGMRERERLMVEYPDLNGPVNRDILGTTCSKICTRVGAM